MTLAKYGWHAFDPEPPGLHLVSCLASVNSSEEMSQQGESREQSLISDGQAQAVHQDKMGELLPVLFPSQAPAGNCQPD